jgi:hypothetical protein
MSVKSWPPPDYLICGVCETEIPFGVVCNSIKGRIVHPECEGGRVRALYYPPKVQMPVEQMELFEWDDVR